MATAIMFILLAVLMLIGVPVGVCLILPCLVMIMINPITTPEFLAQCMYSGISSFTMVALPFFMVAGTIMNAGGLSKRLVRLANACVGNITGSLGMVTVIACMFFGAVSGSAIATVVAIGGIMIPQMIRNGYDARYATALVTAAGGLGVIVPPSYPMVIYAVTANVSVGTLFVAGIVPAFVVGAILIAINYAISKKRGYVNGNRFNWKELGVSLWDAKWAILMPVIILGGIYSGVFTATEAAVVACVYGILVGLFVYKELNLKSCWKMFKDNTAFSGGMFLTMAPAAALGYMFSYLGVTKTVTNLFTSVSTNMFVVMGVIYIILFLIGMFVQTTPAIVIFAPVLLPIAQAVGVDPIHFGIVMVIALAIAFCTPPVAANVFVASTLTGLSMEKIVKPMIPFLIGLIVSLVIVGYVPALSTWLPAILAK